MKTELDLTEKGRLVGVAAEVIPILENIAAAASKALQGGLLGGPEALINPSQASVQSLEKAQSAVRESYRRLALEPAIARVVAIDENGETITFYICRATPVSGIKNLASYRAPIGRLAALEIGDELELPNGSILLVQERAELRPAQAEQGWDSFRTVFEADGFGPITIESLRAALSTKEYDELGEDLVAKLLEEVSLKENVIQGIRRNLIVKIELRDQPVLDQYQDEIFRLPIDSRLVLLGPPGTGKTTTLIRRLGQKIDLDFLDEEEREIIDVAGDATSLNHAHSWLMFTPTELLKQYLKEAFSREDVPAPDFRIRTWADHRRELGRNVLGVLKSASGSGAFVLKDDLETLSLEAIEHPIAWFEDFSAWQQLSYRRDLLEVSAELAKSADEKVRTLGEAMQKGLSDSAGSSVAAAFGIIETESDRINSVVQSLRDSSDAKIRGALNLQLNRDKTFLEDLGRFVDDIQSQAAPLAELEESEEEDEDEDATPRVPAAAALRAYNQSVRAQARAIASKRTIPRSSRNGRIIEWLGQRTLDASSLQQVGLNLLDLTKARRFINPVRRYMEGIPRRYRAFRRLRQQEARWYCAENFSHQDLHNLELDVVLLAMLRGASDLLARPNVKRGIDGAFWSSLKVFRDQCRNQILVDEATDFSPIQLACMAALANPRLRSFVACGDFNQRLTAWGARTTDDLKWIYPDFDIRRVNVAYRQSRQLSEFAREINRISGASESHPEMPQYVDNEGVKPVLLESASYSDLIAWLADRIREIEGSLGQLPSVGILVNSEDQVAPLADALGEALSGDNIQVVPCHEGRVIGSDGSIRVFNVEHIKGLEFEAVFFIGVDDLARREPQMFDKFLYVGATRAATYLGMSCSRELPESLNSLRQLLGSAW